MFGIGSLDFIDDAVDSVMGGLDDLFTSKEERKKGQAQKSGGVIANDVQDSGFTEAVRENADGTLAIDLMGMIGLNLASIQDLDVMVQNNQTRIESLEEENKNLRQEIQLLKNQG
ncbi:hypothetical protein OSG_eHP25_00150 [environmental Halophage eHP-25]|nr:hypothetical protein OSG_eHP25_00150 [environmental Halophage eHP-25]